MKKLYLNPVYKWTPAMFYEMGDIREGVNKKIKKNISRGPVRKAVSPLPPYCKNRFFADFDTYFSVSEHSASFSLF